MAREATQAVPEPQDPLRRRAPICKMGSYIQQPLCRGAVGREWAMGATLASAISTCFLGNQEDGEDLPNEMREVDSVPMSPGGLAWGLTGLMLVPCPHNPTAVGQGWVSLSLHPCPMAFLSLPVLPPHAILLPQDLCICPAGLGFSPPT